MEELELKVNKEVNKAEVEMLAQESKKVTDEKIEKSLNYDLLSQEEKDAIEKFNKKINIEDATQILQYGAKAQTKISQFSIMPAVSSKSFISGSRLIICGYFSQPSKISSSWIE